MSRVCVFVLGVLVLGAVAKPYHVKITKHSSPKSRDLSKHSSSNNVYPPQPTEEQESFTGETHSGFDHHNKMETGVSQAVEGPEKAAINQWKGWSSLREDYGSDEQFYRDVDVFDETHDEIVSLGKNKIDAAKDKKELTKEKKELTKDTEEVKLNYNENDVLPTSKLPKTLPYDPCRNVNCHYGRVCKAYPDGAATCECGDATLCEGHKKLVCGSDGTWYPSHCELHRQACVQRKHISVDHSDNLCVKGELNLLEEEKDKHAEKHVAAELDKKQEKVEAYAVPTEKGKEEKEESDDMMKLQEEDIEIDRRNDPEYYMERQKKDKKRGKNKDKKPKKMPHDIVKAKDVPETTMKPTTSTKIPDSTLRPDSMPDMDLPMLPEICEEDDFHRLKSNLMVYHCARIGENDCHNLGKKKQFLANIMFQYYDRNGNSLLDAAEMADIDHRDHLGKLSRFCHLEDMVTFDDLDRDSNITLIEFYHAFGISHVTLDKKLKTILKSITLGNSLELKCDIQGSTQVVWKRNGGLLSEVVSEEIKLFESGALYIGSVGLEHQGNYTCQDTDNQEVVQTHILSVYMPPSVKVNPSTQFHTTGSTVSLHCRVNGLPKPSVQWEMNEAPLRMDPEHYTLFYNNATLEIKSARFTTDTGAYKCTASNKAGTAQDIATVFIENQPVTKYSKATSREGFLVFHNEGYTVYEPSHCNIEHQVSRSFSKFKHVPLYGTTFSALCPKKEEGDCVWGEAVNVNNQYVYATQPKLNRVVVIDVMDNHNPVEVIQTDPTPVAIHYVAHLDQIWVVSWNGEEDGAAKTAVVIRDAGQAVQHHTLHTQPIGDRFDLIQDLFLPTNNELGQKLNYGYVVHPEQQGLYKVDLTALKYVKKIDFKQYSCVPKTVAFIHIGGQVMVHCAAPTGEKRKLTRLVLDYITDEVLEVSDLAGEPHVSPDGQYMVTVDRETNTIAVYRVKDNGQLQHVFEEYTSFHVSKMSFFPSERGHSYDFYATSTDRNALLYINLASGKIEIIEGVGEAVAPKAWPWSSHSRNLVSGGVFGEYLMTPSDHSALIVNGKRRHVQCEWEELQQADVIVWVEHPPLRS